MIIPHIPAKKVSKALAEYIQSLADNPTLAKANLYGMGAIGAFEEKLRSYFNMEYALSFSSATNALTAIALALNLRDSEIITSPYNYGSSIGGLKMLGNKMIYTNVNDHLNIEPNSIRSLITPKTKAIWAVDFGGYPHDMFEIKAILKDYPHIKYISDISQSLGAYDCDIHASSLSDVMVTSFTYGKSIYLGEGAAILTRDQDIYNKLLPFTHPNRVHLELGSNECNEIIPINGRMNPLAAVMGNALFDDSLINLKKYQVECFVLLDWLRKRQEVTLPILRKNQLPSFFYIFGYLNDSYALEDINTLLIQEGTPFLAHTPHFQVLSKGYSTPSNLISFQYQGGSN